MVYIAADTYFGMNSERDKLLIKNWNKVVKDNDLVILFGEIADKGAAPQIIEDIFKELNGEKKVIGVDWESEEGTIWKEITGKKPLMVNAAVPGEINGKSVIITIYSFFREKRVSNPDFYGAAATSLTHQKELFENNILSLSIDNWGLTPIDYMSVPQLVENMILFNQMEESEVNLSEKG